MTLYPLEHHPPVKAVVWPLTEEITLNTLPSSVPHARSFVAATLTAWVMDTLIEKATLVTSELVSNAVRHSQAGFCPLVTVWLWADARNLLIEVWDEAPGVPEIAVMPKPDAESGRGLIIVSSLSVYWGYYRERAGKASGKVVWAYLCAAP